MLYSIGCSRLQQTAYNVFESQTFQLVTKSDLSYRQANFRQLRASIANFKLNGSWPRWAVLLGLGIFPGP